MSRFVIHEIRVNFTLAVAFHHSALKVAVRAASGCRRALMAKSTKKHVVCQRFSWYVLSEHLVILRKWSLDGVLVRLQIKQGYFLPHQSGLPHLSGVPHLHVNRLSVVQNNGKEMYKKVFCTCKLLFVCFYFLLIRPTVAVVTYRSRCLHHFLMHPST